MAMPRGGREPKDPLHDRHRGNRLWFARELSETSVMAEKLAGDYEKLLDKMLADFPIVESGDDLSENHLLLVRKFKDLSKRLDELGHLVQSFAPVIKQFKTKIPGDAADIEKNGDELVAMAEWLSEGDPVPDALLNCKEKHLLTWRQPHIALDHRLKDLAQPLVNCKAKLTQRAEFLRWQTDGSISKHSHGVWTGERGAGEPWRLWNSKPISLVNQLTTSPVYLSRLWADCMSRSSRVPQD